ncbi:MAG: hypothetical protein IPQ16_11130 [Geobacteraceae bacterium]|nr:hypothetical protein [Geobacteraceae bacterium]
MKNVFFIQRSAIDCLLHNKATAIDICIYLVICKYTDRNGYLSGVGSKAIKERLGIGQKKVDDSIHRLTLMEFTGQRLLYQLDKWLFNETGSQERVVGWVRGWFDSKYIHHVWLNNDLVGKCRDKQRPLNFFVKVSKRDNHARLLLLLYKCHNRQYSGVNCNFASISSKVLQRYEVKNYFLNKSKLGDYHISDHILDKYEIAKSYSESVNILDELRNNNFFDVSVAVIGKFTDNTYIEAKLKYKSDLESSNKVKLSSKKKIVKQGYEVNTIYAYNRLFENGANPDDIRKTYELGISNTRENGKRTFSIKLNKTFTTAKSEPIEFEGLKLHPGHDTFSKQQFVYRLDYKSNRKKNFPLEKCLAGKIEHVAQSCGLEAVSRRGKFYDTYWWFDDSKALSINLIGILMPTHIPGTDLSVSDAEFAILDEMVGNKPVATDLEMECSVNYNWSDSQDTDGEFIVSDCRSQSNLVSQVPVDYDELDPF